MKALPHDGWRSRKVLLGGSSWGLIFAASCAAVVLGYATFDQAASLVQWATPSVLLPTFVGLGIDKLAEAKAKGD